MYAFTVTNSSATATCKAMAQLFTRGLGGVQAAVLDQHSPLRFETDTYLMSCKVLGPSAVLNPNTKLDRRS